MSLPISATQMNFLQMSSVPCSSGLAMAGSGQCTVNVDGVCIKGGNLTGGSTGYQLASMGYPGATCSAAGLFAAGNQKYSVNGYAVSTNAIAFKSKQLL